MIRNRRNVLHFGRLAFPVRSICSKAGSYLQEFLQAQTEESAPPRAPAVQQWRPPDSHCFKVNFDAAVFCDLNRAGLGVIVHDCEGAVLGALSSSIPLAQLVAIVEALACVKAVKFALEIGLTCVVFEGDSAVIISTLTQENGEVASYVVFVILVADVLAKKAKLVVGDQFWLGDLPADIAPIVYRDIH
ncbi:hypothetical protein SO802_006923 [Lithocarpus litseifolius]|uniref:RNase H type-1 domain-containing protein n=1 Tax=Lithocarpus litseifolius TaxID=425828 RepID=A0AAW2DRG4_9ROSI